MIVTCEEADLVLPAGSPRTPGVHLSGIIRGIAIECGILKGEIIEDFSLAEGEGQSEEWWANLDIVSKIRICIGLAWEQWFIKTQLPEVVDHPGELTLDGVHMTPDGEEIRFFIAVGKHCLVVHEVKATYKSTNTMGAFTGEDLESQIMLKLQVIGYCKANNTRFAVVHVLFLCGDYSWPIRPKLLRYSIEFTQAEIDEKWQMLTDWRDEYLGREKA
jgi:hypothetical protein